MKRTFFAAILGCIILVLAGCGGSSSPPPVVTQIFSNPAVDGDIEQTSTSFLITQGNTQRVFAGIDPVTLTEFRAFLDFPLRSTGGVPRNAVIASAVLDIFINNIQPSTGTIPVLIDLVSFPPILSGADFNSTFLATVSTSIFQSDFQQHVAVDVTSLMAQAQALGFNDFQIRILVPASSGFIEINDTTGPNAGALAPILQVTYF